jgi:hypothetical protein
METAQNAPVAGKFMRSLPHRKSLSVSQRMGNETVEGMIVHYSADAGGVRRHD